MNTRILIEKLPLKYRPHTHALVINELSNLLSKFDNIGYWISMDELDFIDEKCIPSAITRSGNRARVLHTPVYNKLCFSRETDRILFKIKKGIQLKDYLQYEFITSKEMEV